MDEWPIARPVGATTTKTTTVESNVLRQNGLALTSAAANVVENYL